MLPSRDHDCVLSYRDFRLCSPSVSGRLPKERSRCTLQSQIRHPMFTHQLGVTHSSYCSHEIDQGLETSLGLRLTAHSLSPRGNYLSRGRCHWNCEIMLHLPKWTGRNRSPEELPWESVAWSWWEKNGQGPPRQPAPPWLNEKKIIFPGEKLYFARGSFCGERINARRLDRELKYSLSGKASWNFPMASSTWLSGPYLFTLPGRTLITACGIRLSGQPTVTFLETKYFHIYVWNSSMSTLLQMLAYNKHSINVLWIESRNNILHWIPLKWKQ